MTIYIIRGEQVCAHAAAPAKAPSEGLVIRSSQEIEASDLTVARLVAIWNALPGVTPVAKFKDRKTAARRLWTAFEQLPCRPEAKPQSAGARSSKQAQVIEMLRRSEGATIDEIAALTGWQRHTVRGMISGALNKKLGLMVVSDQEARGRVYRIGRVTEQAA